MSFLDDLKNAVVGGIGAGVSVSINKNLPSLGSVGASLSGAVQPATTITSSATSTNQTVLVLAAVVALVLLLRG